MKPRLSILIAIAAIAAASGLTAMGFAQTDAIDSSGNKQQLVTVYEKTFADSIVDVVFDEAWVTPQKVKEIGWKDVKVLATKNGQVQVAYPKAVITKNAVTFYSKDGNPNKKLTLMPQQEVMKSNGGRYLVRKKSGMLAEGGAELFDWNGSLLGRILKGQAKEVSDSGTVLVAEDCPEDIGFPVYYVMYDKFGKETGRFKVPERFHNAEGGGAKLTEDGNFFIAAFSQFTETDSVIYYLISRNGDILWKKEMPYAVTGSMPGEHMGLVKVGIFGIIDKFVPRPFCDTKLFMIDWKGEEKWEVPIHLRRTMYSKLSSDFKAVYVMSSAGYFWCIDVQNGIILWKHKAQWAFNTPAEWSNDVPLFRQINAIVGDNDMPIVVIHGIKQDKSRRPSSSTIFLFDGLRGNMISKTEYNRPIDIIVSPNNKTIFYNDKKSIIGVTISSEVSE